MNYQISLQEAEKRIKKFNSGKLTLVEQAALSNLTSKVSNDYFSTSSLVVTEASEDVKDKIAKEKAKLDTTIIKLTKDKNNVEESIARIAASKEKMDSSSGTYERAEQDIKDLKERLVDIKKMIQRRIEEFSKYRLELKVKAGNVTVKTEDTKIPAHGETNAEHDERVTQERIDKAKKLRADIEKVREHNKSKDTSPLDIARKAAGTHPTNESFTVTMEMINNFPKFGSSPTIAYHRQTFRNTLLNLFEAAEIKLQEEAEKAESKSQAKAKQKHLDRVELIIKEKDTRIENIDKEIEKLEENLADAEKKTLLGTVKRLKERIKNLKEERENLKEDIAEHKEAAKD